MFLRKKLDFGHFFIQQFLVKFRQTFFFRFAVQELKGISKGFAGLLFEGGRFSVFGAFRGGWKLPFLSLSFDFGKSLSKGYCFTICRLMAQHFRQQARFCACCLWPAPWASLCDNFGALLEICIARGSQG